ncbi:MAG: dihydroorotase [Alphaproteobacteria bacterium]|nr:dihydroorotase [Alphaproteobacteria bacterium]
MTQHFTKPSWNTKTRLAFTNARLVDPESGLDEKGGLLVENGMIADFGPRLFNTGTPEGAKVIDCAGHVLCPGLFDIQVHFREPGQEYKEVIETGTKSAVAGGVTTVASMANTKPVVDDVSVVDFLFKKARETGYCRVHPYGAITKGIEGSEITEMGLMAEAGAIGFSDDGKPVMNSLVMRRAMEYASRLGVVIAQHAEDCHLSNGGCINEGKVSARLGVTGIPNASEAIIVARDLLLLEITGGHYHVLHVSTHQALDAIRRAKKQGLNVTCEVAPHHFVLTDEAVEEYRTFAKMNPPLRAEEDRLAMIEGLKDGTIDAIATDHAPHDQDSKRVPLSSASFGIVGLETMLPLSLQLYHQKLLSLRDVLARMTYKAADVIHRPGGRLKKGAVADLTLIDLNREWTINPEAFHSKSKNSPFEGFTTKGRAIQTILGGEVVYSLD